MMNINPAPANIPSTLPLHEHNARRRRSRVVPTPGADNQPHSAPTESTARLTNNAGSLLHTYSQFPTQAALHE